MKTQRNLLAVTALALAIGIAGCRKEEPDAASTPAAPMPAEVERSAGLVNQAVDNVVDTAPGQTEVIKQNVTQVATQVQAQAEAATSQVQGHLDKARTLIAEKKWTEALSSLNQLGTQPLTPEQQSALQKLKDEAQAGVQSAAKTKAADEARKAVGGLLPGQR